MSEAPALSAGDATPGRLLGRLRAERNLSVADVAQRLKYAVRQIEALEAEDYARLPGATFVRGMIRGYAKLLEIDPAPILNSLEQRHVPGEITVDLRAKQVPFLDGTRRRGTHMYLLLSAIAFSAVIAVLYEWHARGISWRGAPARKPEPQQLAQEKEPARPAQPSPVTRISAPEKPAADKAPAHPAPVELVDAKGLNPQGRIALEFSEESWVEIKDGSGKMLMAQLNPAGSRRRVSGQPPFSLVIGNAASVHVIYNNAAVDLTPYVKVEVARLTLP